ncbi:hypothetical protein [Engelhardtia mirabilis]|uniref:Pectate lyase superfamily protein n=1 Tax=Engelhardtia mirabilis TaxID=2528011 RepID=A0A518BII1_9BACT|nr:Pectate lyase superfamily protein [Planctomycetes bacterium Pla133]QDV01107.1 Pectate lyase superfamily protein [Planctomycetes bacterium Pla86]
MLSLPLAILALTQSGPPPQPGNGVAFFVDTFGATPNDDSDDDAIAIRQAIDAASSTDDDVIVVFSDGVYHLKSAAPSGGTCGAHAQAFEIGSGFDPAYVADSFHFSGNGAEFVMVDGPDFCVEGLGQKSMADLSFIQVRVAENFKASDFSLDYLDSAGDPVTSTMATIIAEANNVLVPGSNPPKYVSTTDVQILAGYGPPEVGSFSNYSFNVVIDPATLSVKPSCGNRSVGLIETIDAPTGQYRLYHQNMDPGFDQAAVGDLIKIPRPQIGTQVAIRVVRSTGVVIEDVTVHSAPFFALHFIGTTDTVVEGVSIVPGPTPALATIPRLFSANRDGIHFQSPRGVVEVVNCEITHTGDDAIAIHGAGLIVDGIGADPHDLIVDTQVLGGGAGPMVGDSLRAFFDSPTPGGDTYTDLTVTASAYLSGSTFAISTAPALSWGVGTWMENFDAMGVGYLVSGNTCSEIAGRGTMIHSGPGTIFGNSIDHTVGTGIAVHSAIYNTTTDAPIAGVPRGVTIDGNYVTHAALREGPEDFYRGAISVYHTTTKKQPQNWTSADLIQNAVITGNVMRSTHGPDLLISNTTTATVVGNTFLLSNVQPLGVTDSFRMANLASLVDLEWVDQIHFSGNHVHAWGNPGGTIVAERNTSSVSPSPASGGFTIH